MDSGYLHTMAGRDDNLTYFLLLMIRQVMWPAVTVVQYGSHKSEPESSCRLGFVTDPVRLRDE